MKKKRIYKKALKLACERLASFEVKCAEYCCNCDKYFNDGICCIKMVDYYIDKARKELEQ